MKTKEVCFLHLDFLAPSWSCKCGEGNLSCLVGSGLFPITRNWLSKYEWSFQGRPRILRSYFARFSKFKLYQKLSYIRWWRRGLIVFNYKELLVQRNRCICKSYTNPFNCHFLWTPKSTCSYVRKMCILILGRKYNLVWFSESLLW